MKKKVSIDARWLVGGIGTYTRNLLEGLGKHSNGFEVRAITREQHVRTVSRWCSQVEIVDQPIYTLREQWAVPRAAADCDLLHVPHYNAPLLSRVPVIVTIHDIIHISDPHYRSGFKSQAYAQPMLRLVARKAQHVITDSEFSKAQILQYLGVPAAKVSAIPCGVSRDFLLMNQEEARATIGAALGVTEPYLLYVGNLKPHKNLPTLLQAFALLRRRCDVRQKLLLVGDVRGGEGHLGKECARLGIKERVNLVFKLEQDLLPKLYAAADMLVVPSTIEGFGLPVLEAMACGTPVVCSRAASLPEVGGDAVVYFDPQSAEDLAGAMERVLRSSELRQNLRAKGLQRAARFSWSESVAQHLAVYHSVVD